MKTILQISFLLLLALLPSLLHAQATGSISGTVSDERGAAIFDAIIRIQGSQSITTSDEEGRFIFQNLDAGAYTLTAASEGFDTLITANVRVTANQITKLKLILIEIDNGFSIDTDIAIIGERPGLEDIQTGELITSDQIRNRGEKTIQGLIGTSIGVVMDERGSKINVRGSRDTESMTVIDGVQTLNPIDGTSKANVPTSMINEIAVITGGIGAEYGGITSAVFVVTTKTGTKKYSGSVEAITDEVITKLGSTTKQGYNLYNITFGGPLIPTDSMASVINFYGSFERVYNRISGPSWAFNNLPLLFPGGKVNDDDFSSYSYTGRLNVNLDEIKNSKIPIRLRFGASVYNSKGRFYSTSNVLALDPVTNELTTNSHRNGILDNDDYQFYGRLTHTISNKFFYEIQASYFKYNNAEYDPLFGDNVYLYGDTNHNPAATVQGSFGGLDPNLASLFATYGTVRNFYQKMDISYIGGKADATWTIFSKNYGEHEVKFGLEYKYNTLRKMTLFPSPLADLTIEAKDRWYGTNQGSLNSYGYNIIDVPTGTTIATGTDADGTGEKHPITGGFYIRDKVSFSDFNFNGGIRVDFLDVNDEVLKDISYDVTGPDGEIASPDDFTQSKPTIEISPRLGFSFPVTENTIFVAQYGKMIQMPQLNLLYVSKETLRRFLSTSLQDVVENSSLKPTKVTQYEIGIKHQAGDYVDLGVSAFYKESTDLIGAGRVEGPPTRIPNGFATYLNNDFAIARGLDFYLSMRNYNRFSVDIAYTLAFSSGTGSDFNSKFLLANNLDPTTGQTLPRFVYALDYDQRHTGSINMDYRFGASDVPEGWVGDLLQNFGANLLFTFNSGRPYQRKQPSSSATGTGVGELPLSAKNEVYTDWRYRVDLRVDKTVNIWKTNLNFNIYVINLLNTEIINAVYPATGSPDDNGFTQTPTGSSRYETNAFFREYWKERVSVRGNWGPPRQIRFGIRLSF